MSAAAAAVAAARRRRGGGGGGGMSSATASISAPAENFLAALRLAVEILKEPAYPQDEFDRIKTQRLKALEVTPTEPNQLATERLNRHLSPFTKARRAVRADARGADARAPESHAGRGAGSSTISSTARTTASSPSSDRSTPADIQKAAAELLGAWNTAKAYKPLVTPFKKVAPINEKIETPDKANAQFLAGERFQLSQNDPDYPAIVLASYMFGEPITSRISDRIRNREGLSYGANARMTVPAEGDSAMLSGTVSLNPGVGPKVESSFIDELKKVYQKGFTAEEVAAPRRPTWTSRMVGRSTDGALLNLMVVARAAGPAVQVGRGPGSQDPGAHGGADQRRVPQAHRSEGRVDRQGRRFQGRGRLQVACSSAERMLMRVRRMRVLGRSRLAALQRRADADGSARGRGFAPAQPPPYHDASLPVDARVKDLLGRMTLEEKFWQLFMIPGDLDDPANDYSNGIFGLQISTAPAGAAGTARAHAERINAIQSYFVEKTRLGIPIIPFEEAVHGLARDGATMFPAAIALAATWDHAADVAGRRRHRARDAEPRASARCSRRSSTSPTTCGGDGSRRPTARIRSCRR